MCPALADALTRGACRPAPSFRNRDEPRLAQPLDFVRSSNFTDVLADPDNGDQVGQRDDRIMSGATVKHRWLADWAGRAGRPVYEQCARGTRRKGGVPWSSDRQRALFRGFLLSTGDATTRPRACSRISSRMSADRGR